MNGQYEVLNPWSEADPIPLKGISPRLPNLKGKKIGILCNSKQAARPVMTVVERKLKEIFPIAGTSWYIQKEIDHDMSGFTQWVNGVDAVIAGVGD